MCHQNKADWKASFSVVTKCSFLSFVVVKYIHETKVLLGLTTFVACCNVPTSGNISHFVASFPGCQAFSISRILDSLSGGNLISIQYYSVKYDTKDG